MKKIQFFALELGYGGIEREIILLSNFLSDFYNIEIVFLNKKMEELPKVKTKRINYICINETKSSINLLNEINLSKSIKNRIFEYDPDIVISTDTIFNKYINTYTTKMITKSMTR